MLSDNALFQRLPQLCSVLIFHGFIDSYKCQAGPARCTPGTKHNWTLNTKHNYLWLGKWTDIHCVPKKVVHQTHSDKFVKSRLRVTQGHWKRNHWIDHTWLTKSSYLTLNIIVTLKCGLEVTQRHWKWYHLKAWVQFPIRLP